jgi:hypothetical protein
VRDGGLSTERQKTSFPALQSKQLGIENFRSPSIESTGSLSVKGNPTHGISFSWQEPPTDRSFEKLSGPVDNYAIPFQKVTSLALNLDQTSEWPAQYGKASFTYLNSFLSGESEKISYLELIDKESREIALFSYELGIEDFIEYLKSGGFNTDLQFLQ